MAVVHYDVDSARYKQVATVIVSWVGQVFETLIALRRGKVGLLLPGMSPMMTDGKFGNPEKNSALPLPQETWDVFGGNSHGRMVLSV